MICKNTSGLLKDRQTKREREIDQNQGPLPTIDARLKKENKVLVQGKGHSLSSSSLFAATNQCQTLSPFPLPLLAPASRFQLPGFKSRTHILVA